MIFLYILFGGVVLTFVSSALVLALTVTGNLLIQKYFEQKEVHYKNLTESQEPYIGKNVN